MAFPGISRCRLLTAAFALGLGTHITDGAATNLIVSATVINACTISAVSTMEFSSVTSGESEATAKITYQCTNGVVPTLYHGDSPSFAGAASTFWMSSSTTEDKFYLYLYTADYTGMGSTQGTGRVLDLSDGSPQEYTVTGRIDVGTAVRAGAYTATVPLVLAY